jgi:excisionase family DNA binding protein
MQIKRSDEKMIQIKNESYYTVDEIAESMAVSKEAVREWCRSGKLKASRFGKRLYIPAESIKQTLEKNFIEQQV